MLEDIRNFPRQFLHDWGKLPDTGSIAGQVYVAGMGGSSLPADLLNDYAGARTVRVVRDYALPAGAGAADLVLCCSYSGNTEETIACFHDARKRGIPQIALSHGGQLKALAAREKAPWIQIPRSIQPRCASGYFFSIFAALLEKAGKIPPQRAILERLSSFLEDGRARHEQAGRTLAESLAGRVPIIYAPASLEAVARIWKIKVNENAKVQSFYNVLPELNHNEMVGYTRLLMNPSIVFIKSQFMHSRIRKRMEVMESLLSDRIPFHSVELQGEDLLQEMFDAHGVADYSTYHLALHYGVDPAPVEMVENFKKKLD